MVRLAGSYNQKAENSCQNEKSLTIEELLKIMLREDKNFASNDKIPSSLFCKAKALVCSAMPVSC